MLSVQNLTVSSGKTLLLSDIDLSAEKGKVTALLGGSGSGKSTFLKSILPSFRKAYGWSGNVFWNESPLTVENQSLVQTVFQDPHGSFSPFFKMRILLWEPLLIKGLLSFIKEKKALSLRIKELMEAFILDESLLDRKIKELSGGQLQRFAIIRALIANPQLILLDEPVTALDLISQYEVVKIFMQWKTNSNLAFLLVSHDLDLVKKIADFVYVIDKGKIVESGKTPDIFINPKSDTLRNLLESRN